MRDNSMDVAEFLEQTPLEINRKDAKAQMQNTLMYFYLLCALASLRLIIQAYLFQLSF